jgi:3-hydroxybutyryl-CoA dehydrogenase
MTALMIAAAARVVPRRRISESRRHVRAGAQPLQDRLQDRPRILQVVMSAAMTRFAADRIARLAVLGAGTMGHGIAHVAAAAGCEVRLYDALPGAAAAGLAKVRANLDKGVSLGKVDAATRDAALARIQVADDVAAACAGADAVIEAVPERLELKQELFAAVDRAAPAEALYATNTSSLPVAAIAKGVGDPSRVVGMHFFNPVHVMKLVEVVRHKGSDDTAVACAAELATRWGKTPIVVTDSPGFASSRLGLVIGLEAMRMVEQGVASPADIDTAMKLGYGHPMGPLELTDLVGLDVRLGIADYLVTALGPAFAPPEILRDKVARGELGKKSGHGFYQWSPDGKKLDPG